MTYDMRPSFRKWYRLLDLKPDLFWLDGTLPVCGVLGIVCRMSVVRCAPVVLAVCGVCVWQVCRVLCDV